MENGKYPCWWRELSLAILIMTMDVVHVSLQRLPTLLVMSVTISLGKSVPWTIFHELFMDIYVFFVVMFYAHGSSSAGYLKSSFEMHTCWKKSSVHDLNDKRNMINQFCLQRQTSSLIPFVTFIQLNMFVFNECIYFCRMSETILPHQVWYCFCNVHL